MTRETKIGMLVGLGVIVLIGVLLSEYLGGNPSQGQQAADLGKYRGQQYRTTVEQDVGMPNVKGAVPGNGEPVVTRGQDDQMVAFAQSGGGPRMGRPATPEQMGAIPPDPRQMGGQPVLMTDWQQNAAPPEQMDGGQQQRAAPPTVTMQTYVIEKNDTIKSVAKKFLKASGTAEVGKLIAANPGTLKDASTVLVIGKKLNIPVEAVAVVAPAPRPAAPAPAPAPVATKTYLVVKGDTISTIAKKTLGTGGPIATGEILKANGLKDGAIIREGMTLKIPVKTGT